MKETRILALVLISFISSFAYAKSPYFVSPNRVSQHEALEVCPAGTHLPSAREFAERAVKYGAKDIIDYAPVTEPGYRFVGARNMDGLYKPFFFNGDGYQPPPEEKELFRVWTSSVDVDTTNRGNGDGIVFQNDSKDTGFGPADRDSYKAYVICFPGEAIKPKDMVLKEVWSMSHYLYDIGQTYCPLGTHMPTAREMAQLAVKYGAKGILELDQVDPQNIPAGYSKVGDSLNYSCGVRKPFYFNGEGVQVPNEWKNLRFWTYSCHRTNGDVIGHYRFSVNPYDGAGAIFPEYYSDGTHTLCLVGRRPDN